MRVLSFSLFLSLFLLSSCGLPLVGHRAKSKKANPILSLSFEVLTTNASADKEAEHMLTSCPICKAEALRGSFRRSYVRSLASKEKASHLVFHHLVEDHDLYANNSLRYSITECLSGSGQINSFFVRFEQPELVHSGYWSLLRFFIIKDEKKHDCGEYACEYTLDQENELRIRKYNLYLNKVWATQEKRMRAEKDNYGNDLEALPEDPATVHAKEKDGSAEA